MTETPVLSAYSEPLRDTKKSALQASFSPQNPLLLEAKPASMFGWQQALQTAGLQEFSKCLESGPRLVGDEPVLLRLAKLGGKPRHFVHLVQAGFPPRQLWQASCWWLEEARLPLEICAAKSIQRHGFYEDDALLALLVRYYGCTDWRLEKSPWFFSSQEYDRLFRWLLQPAWRVIEHLEAGNPECEQEWTLHFTRVPYAIGMQYCRQRLWLEHMLCRDIPWQAPKGYVTQQAKVLLGYLTKRVNVLRIQHTQARYPWEQNFLSLLAPVMERFEHTLEMALRRMRARQRKQAARDGFKHHDYTQQKNGSDGHLRNKKMPTMGMVRQALVAFGLSATKVDLAQVKQAFRRLSKGRHPDHGGTEEGFCELLRQKETLETWLARKVC